MGTEDEAEWVLDQARISSRQMMQNENDARKNHEFSPEESKIKYC